MLATSMFLGLASTVFAQAPTLTPPPTAAPTAVVAPPTEIPDSLKSTFPATPLVSKTFAYPSGIPYKVDTDDELVRGRQWGYNICNSTTQNQDSLCQTMMVNSLDDFCIWAPPDPNSDVADTEGEMVAWCTKPSRGARLIPNNTLQGIQFMRTPDYIQVSGFINQSRINLKSDDFGGEMDPHGADFRGNPLGGLVYSNAWSNGNNALYEQVIEWHNFIGSNYFCIKACDPAGPNAKHFCEHIYDRIGCLYNAPANVQNGTFESCLGDNQDYPGVYTDAAGAVQTFTQPPESLGPITSFPYTPRTPASSSCTQYQSAVIYAALDNVTLAGDSTSTSASSGPSGTGRPGTALGPQPTNAGVRNGLSFVAVITVFLSLLVLM